MGREDTGSRKTEVSSENGEEPRGVNMHIEEEENLNCIKPALASLFPTPHFYARVARKGIRLQF